MASTCENYHLIYFRQRFGPEFFRRVPSCQGVFWMTDIKRHWLFVGKSKNIKKRLQTFRYEKNKEFAHQVHNIQWRKCQSAEICHNWYEELLQCHRPQFNKLHQPDFCNSISYRMEPGFIILKSGQGTPTEGFTHFHLPLVQHITLPLMRSLWQMIHPAGPMDMPYILTKTKPPKKIVVPLGHWHDLGGLERNLYNLLSFTNIRLLKNFASHIGFLKNQHVDSFLIAWLEKDYKLLNDYFLVTSHGGTNFSTHPHKKLQTN